MENILYMNQMRSMPDFQVIGNLPNSTLTKEDAILSLVIVLGSSISLVSLIFAFMTYSLFSDLRNMSGTMVMNLLATLFMSQLMYVIGVGGTQDPVVCISLAFALQLFHLAEFCWITALVNNMYQTFLANHSNIMQNIPTLKISPLFFKYSLFGWGLPVVIVIAAFFVQVNVPRRYESLKMNYFNCWFLDEKTYVISYVIPVTLLLVATTYRMYKTWIVMKYSVALQVDKKLKSKMRKNRRLQYFLYAKVTVVLTATFISGVVARLTSNDSLWISFNVQHSLQGLIVSIIVACNCQILKLYAKSMRKKQRTYRENLIDIFESRRNSEISVTTSFNSLEWKPELIVV